MEFNFFLLLLEPLNFFLKSLVFFLQLVILFGIDHFSAEVDEVRDLFSDNFCLEVGSGISNTLVLAESLLGEYCIKSISLGIYLT